MITIKAFAGLCGCGAQTLRYYDRIGLLKPVKVDQWSGYRYYDPSQAVDFVKIKNLQAADFSIDEIKALLAQSDRQVYEAFDGKIAEQEQKLERIKQIQQSYLNEKNGMEKVIQSLSGFILSQLDDFEGLREFGLEPGDGREIVERIQAYMEKVYMDQWTLNPAHTERDVTLMVNDEVIRGADQVAERIGSLTRDNLADNILLGDETLSQEEGDFDPEQYRTVWETHGWEHVHEFLDDIPKLEKGGEHCFFFRLKEESYRDDLAFPLFMLGAMILKKGEVEAVMGCTVEKSGDGQNHFQLMRKI